MMDMIPQEKRRAWAVVNLDNAKYNFTQIKSHTKSKLCCVVKANAYGHGAPELATLYQRQGADYLAVSNIDEALQLRAHRISLPILILGYTPIACTKLLAENDITQCVYSREYGMQLSAAACDHRITVKIHIKIDTGMGRIGFLYRDPAYSELEDAVAVCKLPGLRPEGVFMHFAVADEGADGRAYTTVQFEKFTAAIRYLNDRGIAFSIRHCANSAAISEYPEFHLDMVRAGISLYGLQPSAQVKHSPVLKPVMSLHSVISNIKLLKKGETVSYGRAYTAASDRIIATVPIGYADGIGRMNGNERYSLWINSCPAPILGRICMDQLMVDVTDITCHIGDEVLVFGNHPRANVDTLAAINSSINYEIVCNVSARVPRFYIKNASLL